MRIEELRGLRSEKPSAEIAVKVKERWDSIAKPLDGMGRFEEIFCRIGAISGTPDIDIEKKALIVMCADNGVVAKGISQSGQEVTRICAVNMVEGTTSVCRIAKRAGVKVIPTDIGIAGERIEGIRDCRVRPGTEDFSERPAMTEKECLQAIECGMEIVRELSEEGFRLIGTGEMGIGNTTTSTAAAAALLGLDAEEVTGRGAGLDDERLSRKKEIIAGAIKKYGFNAESDAFEVLRTLGGLDIAGLTGVCLGGAKYKVPIVLDGVISCVAAFIAERLVSGVKDYLIASHLSREKVAVRLLEELSVEALIDADMALGEGTGAVMMMGLLDLAAEVYGSERHFEDINISQYKRY